MRSYNVFCCSIIFLLLTGCTNSAGTLGGFDSIDFPTSKKTMELAIDSLFAQYPDYQIPQKWQYLNSWEERGYGFLQSNIFYFKNPPEEMYYVTYIGDEKMLSNPIDTQIAIRAINEGRNRWLLYEDLSENERNRIVKRFHSEIVSKLEHYSKVKARYLSQ